MPRRMPTAKLCYLVVAALLQCSTTTFAFQLSAPPTQKIQLQPFRRPTKTIRHRKGAKSRVTANDPASPSHTLLNAEEEVEYSYRVQTFKAALQLRDTLVKQQNGLFVHPTEAEWAVACGTTIVQLRRILEEGREAKSMLVNSNVGLVVKLAQKHYKSLKYATEAGGGVGTILSVSDMIQEGNLGLMEAAERFDPTKGFRFATYATYWVRQRILRAISSSSRIIRLPVHVHDALVKMSKARVKLQRTTGKHQVSLSELAHYLEVPEEKLRLYTKSSRNVWSLEKPVQLKSDTLTTLGDCLRSDETSPEEATLYTTLQKDIAHVLETELMGLEQQVVARRFGVCGYSSPQSVAQTSHTLSISQDKVRSIETRALHKLRNIYRLKEYYYTAAENTGSSPPNGGKRGGASSQPREAAPSAARLWF